MPSDVEAGARGMVRRNRGLIVPIAIVASLLLIVTPLSPVMMDLLLACNLAIAVTILLTALHVQKPLDFSTLPAVLLGTTLLRLVLNVASTRLILSNGADGGTRAAGGVIEAFGQFVAGGSIVIGLVIFAILVTIQFVVITRGASRISEVAARFVLDGMPGRQMAVDADLNAGIIDKAEAKHRRDEILRQADFYGAMDGASRFIRGDAMAALVITAVNILGGLFVGVLEHGMSMGQAVAVFTTLTIGDGLVSQLPAFLISLAAALIATRSSAKSNLSDSVVAQLSSHPTAMYLAAAFLGGLALTGLPTIPLCLLAAGCFTVGWMSQTGNHNENTASSVKSNQQPASDATRTRLQVEPLELELGVGLVRLADTAGGGDLVERMPRVRAKLARELGIVLPGVRIRDNVHLKAREYQIIIRDVPVARGEVYPDGLLAIDEGSAVRAIAGIDARDPAFGHPARWIEPAGRDDARSAGYQVVSPGAVIATHLAETVREHAHELLTRQHVHQLLGHLRQDAPRLVDEVVPRLVRPALLQQVLVQLLEERISIRDLETILETLGDYVERTENPLLLGEYVRMALGRTICRSHRDESGVLHVVTLDASVEDVLAAGIDYDDHQLIMRLSPQVTRTVVAGLAEALQRATDESLRPVVLCSPEIRAGLRRICVAELPQATILSLNEISRDTIVERAGELGVDLFQETLVAA